MDIHQLESRWKSSQVESKSRCLHKKAKERSRSQAEGKKVDRNMNQRSGMSLVVPTAVDKSKKQESV